MKLISMVDFVVKQRDVLITYKNHDKGALFERCDIYASFLKQPLELWMLVPCDEDGNVLEYNKTAYEDFCDKENVCRVVSKEESKYYRAKERCLFDGFDVRKMEGWNILDFPNNQYSKDFSVFEDAFKELTIEDLLQYNLELTQTVQRQIGCDH